MALIYKMRAIAQSDSSYVFWTDSEPDLDGSNAPESVVVDSIVIDSVGGTATGSGGIPVKHDLTHSPIGLWQFEGDLTDSSGNGYHLSNLGTPVYVGLFENFQMAASGFVARRTVYDAALNIKDALTIEFICSLPMVETSSDRAIVSFMGQTINETEAHNFIYVVRLSSSNTLQMFSEYGAGNNSFRTSTITQSNMTKLCHVAVTQSSDGTTNRFYLNGVFQNEVDGINAPTGGTSGSFAIMGYPDGTAKFNDGLITSVKIIDYQLSDEEVKAEYNRTLGPVLGVI